MERWREKEKDREQILLSMMGVLVCICVCQRLLSLPPVPAQVAPLLGALGHGCPPHAGIALGLDRLAMLMTGASSLRGVIAFPKTTQGNDLLMGAPAPIPEAALSVLCLTWK